MWQYVTVKVTSTTHKTANRTNQGRQPGCREGAFAALAQNPTKLAIDEIRKTKAGIFAEARESFGREHRMLQLALNEAEAIAWETKYPHLVFPALAGEKVEALKSWRRHQKAVRKLDPTIVLAA